MFAQVIQGQVRDRDGLREQLDRWERELKPGAHGYLGSTAGVAENGQFVAVVRFESEEAARVNSNRPEQGAWWEETAKLLDGEAAFHDCPEVDLLLGGGSDDAGFVQVIQGRGDRKRMLASWEEGEAWLRRNRPDLLGGLTAWHGAEEGRFTQVAYFTSEAEARRGESQQLSGDDADMSAQYASMVQDVTYIDLKQPWLSSP